MVWTALGTTCGRCQAWLKIPVDLPMWSLMGQQDWKKGMNDEKCALTSRTLLPPPTHLLLLLLLIFLLLSSSLFHLAIERRPLMLTKQDFGMAGKFVRAWKSIIIVPEGSKSNPTINVHTMYIYVWLVGRSGLSTWKYQFLYDNWSQAILSSVSTWMDDCSSVAWVLLLTLKLG